MVDALPVFINGNATHMQARERVSKVKVSAPTICNIPHLRILSFAHNNRGHPYCE
jgi:hypothetical protein